MRRKMMNRDETLEALKTFPKMAAKIASEVIRMNPPHCEVEDAVRWLARQSAENEVTIESAMALILDGHPSVVH